MMQNIKYFSRLLRSLGWGWHTVRTITGVLTLGVLIGATTYYMPGGLGPNLDMLDIDASFERAATATSMLTNVEAVYDEQVAPIERVLLGYRDDDPQLVRRVAVGLVRESRRTQLEPRLLLAVLLVENPWLDNSASSFVGAQGLMQVMPFHRGKWSRCVPRLDDIDANICHGAHIFAAYLREEKGNVDRALLRYNGCVRGTNTPTCHQYPNHVYARAGRASLLAWRPLSRGTMAASP